MLRFFSFVLACIISTSAFSLEMGRNDKRFDFTVHLPYGGEFINDGIDRKFYIHGIEGNLRLIQDYYEKCANLVKERRDNWKKYGFTTVKSQNISPRECSIGLENESEGLRTSSFYVWMEKCKCFSALHFNYSTDSRSAYSDVMQPILDSLRSNNRNKPGSYDDNTNMGRDKYNNYEVMTCQEKKARGYMADWDEIDHCGLPRREKPGPDPFTATNETEQETTTPQNNAGNGGGAGSGGSGVASAPANPPNQVTFNIRNEDYYELRVKFFSRPNNDSIWPSAKTSWILDAGGERKFPLACKQGQKICIGAQRKYDSDEWVPMEFGVGLRGTSGCENCCRMCGSGTHNFNIPVGGAPEYRQKAPSYTPSPAPNVSSGPSADDLIQGLAAGISIFNTLNNGGGYAPPPRAPAQRPSGISQ